jgi:hypothetical protein
LAVEHERALTVSAGYSSQQAQHSFQFSQDYCFLNQSFLEDHSPVLDVEHIEEQFELVDCEELQAFLADEPEAELRNHWVFLMQKLPNQQDIQTFIVLEFAR